MAVTHPTLPYVAYKESLGTVIRTAYLPHLSPPIYHAPVSLASPPLALPLPLPSIRLPGLKEGHNLTQPPSLCTGTHSLRLGS